MKTSCPAFRALSSLVLAWGVAWAVPASAQVSNTYNVPPPPGYPAPGTGLAPRQPSTKASRQSAAAIQAPATYPQYPPAYPPPAGYTYPPPPGYGMNQPPAAPKTASSKGKSSAKTPAAKPAGPPPPPKVYGPTGDLSTQVEKLRDSDKVQNMRIGALERDVGSIKRSGKGGARYDGGSDLAAYTTYISRPGDTLWSISSKHRVSVGEIQQLNRMTGEEVSVGQTLLIPSPHRTPETTTASYTPPTLGSPPPAPAAATTTTVVTAPLYYTVKKGDSLKGIAQKHKTTAVALATANKIKDVNKIAVGQRIKIPGRTTKITVAAKTKAPRAAPSDTVPLPGFGTAGGPPPPAAGLGAAPPPAAGLASMPAAPPSYPASAPAPKTPDMTDSHRGILAYRVDRADTIESIATQFTTTPDHIREMNRLVPGSTLKAGDEIMVPAMGAVSLKN